MLSTNSCFKGILDEESKAFVDDQGRNLGVAI